jgi:hypothetical protein
MPDVAAHALARETRRLEEQLQIAREALEQIRAEDVSLELSRTWARWALERMEKL